MAHQLRFKKKRGQTLFSLLGMLILIIQSCQSILVHSEIVALAQQGDEQPDAPLAADDHPRLFFTANEIPMLREKAATSHQGIWQPIQAYANMAINSTLPPTAPADGDLDTYRNYGNRLIGFAFACVITQAADHCNLAKAHLLTYAAWQQWGEDNETGLGLAHMLLGNALAFDWLYHELTPEEQERVAASLASWAQKMYAASVGPENDAWNNWWHKSYIQNHYWTTNSALGMAGLALLGHDPQAQVWVDQAQERIQRVVALLTGIGDGTWHESIAYQNYGLTMLLPFLVNLRQLQGIDLLPAEYLRNYIYWRLYNHLPNSTRALLAYGDFEWSWGNSYRAQNILRFLANEYDNGHAEWLAQQLIAADGRYSNVWSAPWYVLEFLYYDSQVTAQPPTALDHGRFFPDLAAVIWRTGWGEDDLLFGLKAGAQGGRFAYDTFTQELSPWEAPCAVTGCSFNIGHNHDDTNSFYLYRAGQWLAPEVVGVDNEETPFHNTLLIDGQGQYRPPNANRGERPVEFFNSNGSIAATANTPHFDYIIADATQRYQQIAGIQQITRHVLFVRPAYLLIIDQVAAETAHDYAWVSHFAQTVAVEGDWIWGGATNGQRLGIKVIVPQPFTYTTGDDGQPYIHVQPTSPVDDIRFVHLLYPTSAAAWETRPDSRHYTDNGESIFFSVGRRDGSGQIDNVLLTYGKHASTDAKLPYAFDGRVAIVTRTAADELQRLFVYGGAYLADQARGEALVTNLDQTLAFEAIYEDQIVRVSGNMQNGVRLYAPKTTTLILNGVPWPFIRVGDYIEISTVSLYLPLVN